MINLCVKSLHCALAKYVSSIRGSVKATKHYSFMFHMHIDSYIFMFLYFNTCSTLGLCHVNMYFRAYADSEGPNKHAHPHSLRFLRMFECTFLLDAAHLHFDELRTYTVKLPPARSDLS